MLVLASILFCLVGVRLALPSILPSASIQINPDQWAEEVRLLETTTTQTGLPSQISKHYGGFYFDPNTISESEIIRLGFSEKQAKSWINYRKAGATFSTAKSLQKLFFIDQIKYDELEPWIRMEKSILPQEEKATQSVHTRASKQAISINTCDSTELVSIRGIGAYTASKVIQYRTWLGGFTDTSQYREIHGLREAQIQTLQAHCQLDPGKLLFIFINQATEEELIKHPYIRYKAKVIIRYRTQHGSFKQAEDLLATGVIDEPLLEKIRPYLKFE